MGRVAVISIVSFLSFFTVFAVWILSPRDSRVELAADVSKLKTPNASDKFTSLPQRNVSANRDLSSATIRSSVPSNWQERARRSAASLGPRGAAEKIAGFKKSVKERVELRTASLNALRDSAPDRRPLRFSRRSGNYEWMPNVRAYRLREVGEDPMPNEIKRSAGLVFVRNDHGESRAERPLPVVYNASTNRFGALTGNFTLKLKDPSVARNAIQDHGLTLVQAFGSIQTVVAHTDKLQGDYLIQLLDELQKDPRFSQVTLDVKESTHAAN